MTTFSSMLTSSQPELGAIERHLDGLPAPERLRQVLALGPSLQRSLWELASAGKQLGPEYLVPADAPPLALHPFEGRNSLPAFSRFAKVFYRQPDGGLAGYNRAWIAWLIGNGYFTCAPHPQKPEHELRIDYTILPQHGLPEVGPVRSNDLFPSRFVYGGMRDDLRRVAADVLIGRAFDRAGKAMDAWFVLCRWNQPTAART